MAEQENGPFILGIAGLAVGFSILGAEMEIFFYDITGKAIANGLHTLPPAASVSGQDMNFSSYIAVFVILGIILNLIIGLKFSPSFVLGFICGDGIVLLVSAASFWPAAPAVVTGMVLALFIAVGSLVIRQYLKKPHQSG